MIVEKIAELPDSSFAYIEPGGVKDASGRTAPGVLRHLPYKNAAGVVDLDALASALNAVKSANLPRATQARVYAKLESVARRHAKAEGVEKYITHDGDKWQVHAESGKVLGTHESRADAAAQLAAIEAHKHDVGKGGGSVEWPVMPRPEFRGSSLSNAGEKAPNQKIGWTDEARAKQPDVYSAKGSKSGDNKPEWADDAKAAQAEAEKHGFEEALKTDAGARMSHPGGTSLFVHPSGKWHHTDQQGAQVGTGQGAADLGAHLGRQADHMGALPVEPQATKPAQPIVPGKPVDPSADPEFERAYADFKAQVKAAVVAKAGPGSRVQALIFDKDKYKKPAEAKAWANDHGFERTKVDEAAGSWRMRQSDPGEFDRMRTISLTEGVQAVVGFPKKTIKAVQQAFFLTASGRLAFKTADIVKAECEPVSDDGAATIFRVKCAGHTLHFAATGDSAAYLPAYEMLSKSAWTHVFKAEEQRYTLTVVYPASGKGAPEPDFHGDVMSEEELEKSAWGFMGKGQDRIGLMHRPGTAGAGKVVESYIWRGPEWKMKDTSGQEQSVSPGDWVMGIVWSPEAWAAIKSGQLTGVSLQGAAKKEAF